MADNRTKGLQHEIERAHNKILLNSAYGGSSITYPSSITMNLSKKNKWY